MLEKLNILFNQFRKKSLEVPVNSTISPEDIARYNLNRTKNVSGTFCCAPSTNMLFAQDGSVRVCCHNLEYITGKYPEQSIDEIWNSTITGELSQSLKNYNLSKGCKVCQQNIDIGAYEESASRYFDTLPQNRKYPVMMEFLLSNTCNLECEMCQGDFSSLIRKNREKRPPLQSPYGNEFIKQLHPYLLQLSEARFSGSGEAFAIDIYYEIWETLINENPGCKILIQTNGTYMNARIKDFLERGNFHIGVSLDSLEKKKFESIRKNALFEQVMKNIEYFSDYSLKRNRMFLIGTCVMRNNWNELPAFVEFCDKVNAQVLFHKVYSPEHLSLSTLPEQELKSIYNKLAAYSFNLNGALAAANIRHYKYFTNVISGWAAEAAKKTPEMLAEITLHQYQQQMEFALAGLKHKYSDSDLANFRHKLSIVVDSFEEEKQKKYLYHRALKMDPEMLVDAMLKYSEEYLQREANNFFKI